MKLALDTCVLNYLVEGAPELQAIARDRILQLASGPADVLTTQRLSRLEFRIRPLRDKHQELLDLYEALFSMERLRIVEATAAVLETAAELRARHGFATPDAIHLATAICGGADAFLTADTALSRCPGIRVDLFHV